MQQLGRLVLDFLVAGDLRENIGLRGCQELQQIVLETAHIGDRNIVQVAIGGGPDDGDFLLDRERLVLALLESLSQTLATLDLCLGIGIKIRAELRKGSEGAEPGQFEAKAASRSSRNRPASSPPASSTLPPGKPSVRW